MVPPSKGEYARTYRKRGSKYVLEEVEVTSRRDGPRGGTVRQREVQRIRLVKLHENPARDRARREKRGARPASASIQPQYVPVDRCTPDTLECGGGEEPPPPPPPPPYVDPCPATGGVNLLFQHGIMSNGGTWDRMDRWMRCSLQTNAHIRPSIDWTPSIPAQRGQLEWMVSPQNGPLVLVGHSNGGPVSRSLAQWAQENRPGVVRGVVTLDSPNRGAVIAANVNALEFIFMPMLLGPGWIWTDLLMYHPFYEDDVPYSPFLLRTNAFNEDFTRVGIQTHTPKRWVAWRVLRTPADCYPDSHCGERAVARHVQESYDRHRHYARFWYRPWQSIPAAAQIVWLNGLDAAWNLFTAPGMTTDGFIHGPGQVYPNAMRNRLIQNGDSHVGTTKSPYVRDELANALRDPALFNIPPR